MNKNFGFLITAFDQVREVTFTVHMLRNIWKSTKESPVVIVISGDKDNEINFPDDPYTRVVHLRDIVGENFRTMVSTSIMRQIQHGMLEMTDLERQSGPIDNIAHMHGDILLLSEDGFFAEVERWKRTELPVAADTVGPQSEVVVDNSTDVEMRWKFFGKELMPQLFLVDNYFCKFTGFMYDMTIMSDAEKMSTEWALIGNLHRAVFEHGNGNVLLPVVNPDKDADSPYGRVIDEYVHVVNPQRTQWDTHSHFGGFCHYGNSLHFSRENREARATTPIYKAYGRDVRW